MHCASPRPVSRGPQFRVQRPCRAICGISCPVTQISAPSPPDRALRRRCRFTGTQPSLVCRGSLPAIHAADSGLKPISINSSLRSSIRSGSRVMELSSASAPVRDLGSLSFGSFFPKGCYRHTHDRAVIAVLIVLTLVDFDRDRASLDGILKDRFPLAHALLLDQAPAPADLCQVRSPGPCRPRRARRRQSQSAQAYPCSCGSAAHAWLRSLGHSPAGSPSSCGTALACRRYNTRR